MPKGTILFIHGTGERLKDAAPFLEHLQTQLDHFKIDYTLESVAWGDAVGVEFEGKSLPDPPQKPSPDEAEWSYLAADPLFGLRLIAGPDISREGSGLLGKPKWVTAWEMVKAYRPTEDLSALLIRGSLKPHWELSAALILGDPIARQAFESSGDNTAEPLQALARAIVAQMLIDSEQREQYAPTSKALRDKLYDRLVYDWGASVRGIGDRIAKFLTGLARSHRAQWSTSASLKVGDILLYQVHGKKIRESIAAKVAKCQHKPVVLLAHSLGGVACVDLLAGSGAPKVAGLVTMGSQAPLFFEFGALQSLEDKQDLPKSFPPWINFYDRNDFLSYVGGRLFTRMADWETKSGLAFPAAHSGYFSDEETWLEVKRFLDKL